MLPTQSRLRIGHPTIVKSAKAPKVSIMSNSDVINQLGCVQGKTFPIDVANALIKSAVFDANRHQFDNIQVASYVVIAVGFAECV